MHTGISLKTVIKLEVNTLFLRQFVQNYIDLIIGNV